tara:strand:- start:6421 stop:6540 length:120 start_codon:yes stop_codon:yes gene_type:complete
MMLRYCDDVDGMLREELGDTYEAWEDGEDGKVVPDGLVF